MGDIVRLGHPPQHRALLGSFDDFGWQHAHPFGSDESRRYRIHVHVGRAELHGGSTREAQKCGLARGIVRHPEAGALGLMRAHADDLTVVLAPEDRRHRAYAVEGTRYVGLQDFRPRYGRQPPQGAIVGNARVVDEKMDSAELLLGLGDELLDGVPIPNVAAAGIDFHAHGAERRLREQRLFGDVPPGQVHEAECYVAAEPTELHGNVTPESGGPAGHDDHLATPAFADGLRAGVFEGGPARLRRLVFPGGPMAEAEGWQGHGVRSYEAFRGRARIVIGYPCS